MRILVFTQYFVPEVGATQTRLHTFAAGLTERGHEVEVICEVPNHPRGVVHPQFTGRLALRRRLDGFRVWYVWVRTSPRKSSRGRIAFYASYAGMATVLGASVRRPDVILASSPPLPVAAAAALVARWHGTPWVMDVRDLWPQAAVALGELSGGRALRLAEWLERRLYREAAAITAVTEPFREAIAAKAPPSTTVRVIPNGTTRLWVEASRWDVERKALELPADKFIWTFAGNVGLAQGLDASIDAAAQLDDGFRLLILGDGAAREELERRARAVAPKKVLFRDQVQPELAARYLRASDALLVPLAPDPRLASFVPSKLFDCCAVGRPVVVAAAGEPQRLASEASAVYVPPGDAPALAETLHTLREQPQRRHELSRAAGAFGAAHLREHGVEVLVDVLKATVAGHP